MNILQEIKGAGTIGISGHIRPDGDCVGSCMGLALYLRKMMPKARVDVFLDDFSESLARNIAGSDTIISEYETDVERYDVFICLDCEKTRLGDALPLFSSAAKTVNIDHHVSNPGCGEINYIVPGASSTCELIYDVIDEEMIDCDIAKNLYIGMMTDTGVFKFSNTSRRTMEIAGRLIEFGFDFPRIIQEVFDERTYVQQQILGRALLESVVLMDGRCIFSVINRKLMQFYNAGSSDLDGIVSALVNTKGVDCSIFLYETLPMTFKVSMRSNGRVDVAKIAVKFGGGGHMRAAGATINARYRDIINSLTAEIEEQLKAAAE